MPANVLVMGMDDAQRPALRRLEASSDMRFHPLLTREELQGPAALALDEVLERSRADLRRFPGRVDAITGYWDFPVTCLLPVLADEFGVRSPRLDSILACEHKYWSRLRQREVTGEVPEFAAVDPFDDAVLDDPPLPYPFWLKPVKSFNSRMAFKVPNERWLRRAVMRTRAEIGTFGEPFNEILRRVELPGDVAEVDGLHCLAESPIGGFQCTVEGHVWNGEVRVHGIVDSFRYTNRSSFQRYQYPSRLPRAVRARMAAITTAFVRRVELDHSAFNVEFFYDARRDRTWLLEVNPRISQSHADVFEKVDGVSNLRVMADVALGRRPEMPVRQGRYACAAKCFVRVFEKSGTVVRVPTGDEIARIQADIPGVTVRLAVSEGASLSEAEDADAYSSELAHVFVGAGDTAELLDRHRRCVEALRPLLRVEPSPREAAAA